MAIVLVLIAIVAIVWFSVTEIQDRLEERDRLTVESAVLTGEPIDIQAIDGGTILETRVAVQDSVQAGDVMAVLQPPPGSLAGPDPVEVVSPVDATILTVAPTGSTLSGGSTVVRMYDPSNLYFEVPVDFDTLADVKIGMTAVLELPSVGAIDAEVVRVDSDLLAAGAPPPDSANLILEPADPEPLAAVVPGAVLAGWIELDSAPAGAPTGVSSVGVG